MTRNNLVIKSRIKRFFFSNSASIYLESALKKVEQIHSHRDTR